MRTWIACIRLWHDNLTHVLRHDDNTNELLASGNHFCLQMNVKNIYLNATWNDKYTYEMDVTWIVGLDSISLTFVSVLSLSKSGHLSPNSFVKTWSYNCYKTLRMIMGCACLVRELKDWFCVISWGYVHKVSHHFILDVHGRFWYGSYVYNMKINW